MKQLIYGILVCLIIAILISTIKTCFSSGVKLDTLYAVTGIMFSIGMSIIVTTSFSKIKNKNIRTKIQISFKDIRCKYICVFLFASILYMFQSKSDLIIHVWKLNFSYKIFLGVYLLYSILFFIVNFIEIQKLNNQIDDLLDD